MKEYIKLIQEKIKVKYLGRDFYFYKPKNEELIIKKKSKLIYTNWFKVLVNQKIDYSLSKESTYDKDNLPDEFNIDDILEKMTLNASLDSTSWLQLTLNGRSKLDWIIIDDSEIIPIYDSNKKYIKNIIKFWKIPTLDKRDDYFVQIWDSEKCIEFKLINWQAVDIKTIGHYLDIIKYKDEEESINPKSFGFIPFLPLFNNKNHESDVVDIYQLLDVYNQISTGFIDNVYEFQEAIYKLKGFNGQDYAEFLKQLRTFKYIPLDENGDIDKLTIDIPVEARKTLLDILQRNILMLGRGVDPNEEFGGSNITNVLIKAKYANLDSKASDMEKQIRLFYRQLVYILNLYYNITIDRDINFNRSQIFNQSEQIDDCLKSMGLTSIRTILENHPFVKDVEEELKRISNENSGQNP